LVSGIECEVIDATLAARQGNLSQDIQRPCRGRAQDQQADGCEAETPLH